MAGPVIVVDASVAVKWVIPEPGSDLADALLYAGEALVAPSVILVEVAAAIAKRTDVGLMNLREAGDALADFRKAVETSAMAIHVDRALLDSALALSATLRHPLADCLYVALAQSLDGTLATADRNLADAAERAGLAGRVRRIPPQNA